MWLLDIESAKTADGYGANGIPHVINKNYFQKAAGFPKPNETAANLIAQHTYHGGK